MGAAGRALVNERYSLSNTARRMHEMFTSIVANKMKS